MEDICNIIVVCCILHNVCINSGDPHFDIVEDDNINNDVNHGDENSNRVGSEQRDYLAGMERRNRLKQWWMEYQHNA